MKRLIPLLVFLLIVSIFHGGNMKCFTLEEGVTWCTSDETVTEENKFEKHIESERKSSQQIQDCKIGKCGEGVFNILEMENL